MILLKGRTAPARGYSCFTGHLPVESPFTMCCIMESYNAVSSVNEAGGVLTLTLSVSLLAGSATLPTAAAAFSELQEPEIRPVETTSTKNSAGKIMKVTRFISYCLFIWSVQPVNIG